MGDGFSNPVVGGTSLVRPSIKSPNYSAGLTGWAVNKDGSAEFNNVAIRGSTVTNGTILIYNGTPTLGNLIMSIAGSAGTDSYGNSYPASVKITNATLTSFYSLLDGGSITMTDGVVDNGAAFSISDGSGSTPPALIVQSPNQTTTGRGAFKLFGESPNGSVDPFMWVEQNIRITGAIIQANGSGTSTTWQTPGYGTNWSGATTFNGVGGPTLQYRLDAEDNLWLYGIFKAGATLPANPIFTLPANWRPANAGWIYAQRNNGGTLSVGTCFISATGNVDLFAGQGMGIAVSNEYFLNGKIPMGNIG
jgi:hypothetical protein